MMTPMDSLTFVVRPGALDGVLTGIEPFINGTSLVDLTLGANGTPEYAGFTDVERSLSYWREALAAGGHRSMAVLGCTCGDRVCDSVWVDMSVDDDMITWSNFRGGMPVGRPGGWESIRPFRFDLASYATALAAPRSEQSD
jgi:hypothetical protein